MPQVGPDSQLGVVRSIKALRARVDAWRANGLSVAFVPTMGALHDGHLSLIRLANEQADRTVASIFVNPRQFAAGEDFTTYPRPEAADLERLQSAGCSLAYTPAPEEMYPAGFETVVTPGATAGGLCAISRPHFFGGVATVVCKLLNQCRPDVAVFGEKDYQQLLVIRRMVRDLDMPVAIIGAPIMREADGLAMSSRNAYLTPGERAIAGRLNRVLMETAARLENGERIDAALASGRAALESAGLAPIDYFELRRASDLAAIDSQTAPEGESARLLVAVMLGRTRLIDNWPVERNARSDV